MDKTSPPVNIPEETKPFFLIKVLEILDGDAGIRKSLRRLSDPELNSLKKSISDHSRMLPIFLDTLGLPPLESGEQYWVGKIVPEINRILNRNRSKPKIQGITTIDELRKIDIVQLALRFTNLRESGARLKGLCPLHIEKSPSFNIYPETQSWYCFGACKTGGDVINLVEQLKMRGMLNG